MRSLLAMIRPFALVLLLAAPAAAQTAPDEAESAWNEVQQSSAEALGTHDCAVACRALESMERATNRLCSLGEEHCQDARAKLEEARARVRATCPECAAAKTQTMPGNVPPPPQMREETNTTVAAEPPRKSGGCAGCDVGGGDPSLFALVALLLLRRKRKL